MKIHITNLYNQMGTQGIAQNKVYRVAKEMGFCEMALYRYDTDCDTDVELGKRIDGILPALQYGDIVIFQSPSWNKLRYDRRLIQQIKLYRGVKLIILIHDVIPLAFNSSEEMLNATIEIYNMADLIIAPSNEMLKLLIRHGLRVERQIVQEVWDYPISFDVDSPQFYKRMFFTGAPSRFPFLNEWKYETLLELYTGVPFSVEELNINLHGYKREAVLLSELSEGGYGLVWPSDEANDYYRMIQPYKVASYLAAGIPVIMKKGIETEKIIINNGLGYVVDSLEEANDIVQRVTESEYLQMVKKIADFNALIKDGWFTKKILTDAVMWLLNKNFTK